jgi:LPXTG-site transpeptidase (sortase) family protein
MAGGPVGKPSLALTILLPIAAGYFGMSLSIVLQTQAVAAEQVVTETSASASNTATPVVLGAGSTYQVPSTPVRLIIPAIGVDAHIQSVGLAWQGDGTMGIPTNFTDVGWYDQGPRPGTPGNAVIDGHFDGKDVPQAVFYNLKNLVPGDLVKVEDRAGNVLQFRVTETKLYDYTAPTDEIFSGDSSVARLNLITCGGSWNKAEKVYNKRVVIFTELVKGA